MWLHSSGNSRRSIALAIHNNAHLGLVLRRQLDPIQLAQWPKTVPERIDRCLCNLANYRKGAGEVIEIRIREDKKMDALLFAANRDEARYYINALE